MATQTVNALTGLAAGYEFGNARTQEVEVQQGKNFIIGGLYQTAQISQIGVAVDALADKMPAGPIRTTVKVLCNVVPIVTLPFFLFTGTVRQGEYENFSGWWNQRFTWISIPKKIGACATKLFGFIAEHAGTFLQVAMVVSAVALIILGKPFFGVAILATMTYQVIDHLGWVPRKISLFMESYMPILSLVGLLVGGTPLIQVFAALMLPTRISPTMTRFLHHRLDDILRFFGWKTGPSLSEVDGDVKENKELTFSEIKEILDAPDSSFVVDPAHSSKWAFDFSKLPKDYDLNKLLEHFNKVDWKERYELVKRKMKTDERFIDELKEAFPQYNSTEESFNECFAALAERKNKPLNEFAADWMKEQMNELMHGLLGNKRVKGSQKDLADAISMCYKIIPYLEQLKDANESVEYEDMLLKCAVEGGNYCSRGVKRMANELVGNVTRHTKANLQDPQKAYEQTLASALQDRRYAIIQLVYDRVIRQKILPDAIAHDVHSFDLYRNYLSLGFYPLTKYERATIGISEFLVWKQFASIRSQMSAAYQKELDSVIHEIGESEFSTYMRKHIGENPSLSESERKTLLYDIWGGRNNDTWSTKETDQKMHRLALVMLGVLRKAA